MLAIIASILLAGIAILTILVVCGLPLGEFTMGGQNKVLPKRSRIMAVIAFIVQLFAITIILQAGGLIALWFSHNVTKYICVFFASYLSVNTIINLLSKSKKEKYAMTPLSFFTAICFWVTALGM